MRTLIVGTTPPPGGQAGRELAAVAAARTLAGDRVEILSPDPRSAAHHTGNLGSLLLPLRLALLTPRFDALIVRIEPGLPFGSTAGRLLRGATLLGLGWVAGMFDEVTLRLDSPIALPGGVGGRAAAELWRRATAIVVANEHDRQQLLAAPGINPERITIADPLVTQAASNDRSWPVATDNDLRVQVLSRIRQRAQAERQANSARVDLGAPDVGPLAAGPFSTTGRATPSAGAIARATLARVAREASAHLPRSR